MLPSSTFFFSLRHLLLRLYVAVARSYVTDCGFPEVAPSLSDSLVDLNFTIQLIQGAKLSYAKSLQIELFELILS